MGLDQEREAVTSQRSTVPLPRALQASRDFTPILPHTQHTHTHTHTHRIARSIPFSRHIQYPMWFLHLNLSEKLVVEHGKVMGGGAGTEVCKLVSANSKD